MEQYDPTPGILNVLFTVEGAHAFFHDSHDGSEAIGPVLERLTAFIGSYRPVAINLCHFQTHTLAAQAYAFIFRTYRPKHRDLFPVGSGISTKGHRFIETCHEQGVLVDLKHMGLSARREFYASYPNVPLLASHVGLTGLRSNGPLPIIARKTYPGKAERLIYRKPKGHLANTCFNPISINFYDEDIEAILRSSGMIGLSLDQRILGASQPMFILDHVKRKEREFVSIADCDLFTGGWGEYAQLNNEDEVLTPDELGVEDDDIEIDDEGQRDRISKLQKGRRLDNMETHPRFLANQVIHIARVARAAGLPWKEHIAIGSDMDGLINAVDHCMTVERYEDLQEGLRRVLMTDEAREAIGEPYDTDELIEKIMHGNALAFLKKNAFGEWKNPT